MKNLKTHQARLLFQKLELDPSPIPMAQKKLKPEKFRPIPALDLQHNNYSQELYWPTCSITMLLKAHSHYYVFHVRLQQKVVFLQGDKKIPIFALMQPTAENVDSCIQCESALNYHCAVQLSLVLIQLLSYTFYFIQC